MTDVKEFEQWARSVTGTLFCAPAPTSKNFYFDIWLAGKRAGRAEMREELARACEEMHDHHIASFIRDVTTTVGNR